MLNQQQQPNTRYTIEVTAQGSASAPQAATPDGLDPVMTTPNRSGVSNDGGGGAMYWLAILSAISLKRRGANRAT